MFQILSRFILYCKGFWEVSFFSALYVIIKVSFMQYVNRFLAVRFPMAYILLNVGAECWMFILASHRLQSVFRGIVLIQRAGLSIWKRGRFWWFRPASFYVFTPYLYDRWDMICVLLLTILHELIPENVFSCQTFYRGYLFKNLHIKILFVAKHGITIRLVRNVLICKVNDIL